MKMFYLPPFVIMFIFAFHWNSFRIFFSWDFFSLIELHIYLLIELHITARYGMQYHAVCWRSSLLLFKHSEVLHLAKENDESKKNILVLHDEFNSYVTYRMFEEHKNVISNLLYRRWIYKELGRVPSYQFRNRRWQTAVKSGWLTSLRVTKVKIGVSYEKCHTNHD